MCKTLIGAATVLILLAAYDQSPADPVPPPPQTPVGQSAS